MGFKFKRFRAKLNWKQKTTVPEVVCIRYHITSEFTENLPEILSTQTNGIQQEQLTVVKENNVPLIKDNTDRTRSETNKEISTTSENRLQNLEEKTQPKSILKKSVNNSPDLENHTQSPIIFMTENHNDKNEQKSVDPRSNLENSDGSKIVNWRETIEFISLNEESQINSKVDVSDKSRLSSESKSDSEDEDDDGVQVNTYGNGISYSTQASNIFFAPN